MKQLTIRIKIDGKVRKFKAPKHVSSDVLSRTLVLEEELENNGDFYIVFNKAYPLICEIFDNKFTVEQLKKGTETKDIIPLVNASLEHVVNFMALSPQKKVYQ